MARAIGKLLVSRPNENKQGSLRFKNKRHQKVLMSFIG